MQASQVATTHYNDGFSGWDTNLIADDPNVRQLGDEVNSIFNTPKQRHKLIGCVIPAYNEEKTIGNVLESLLNQTVVPDEIHVVVNNTTDRTVETARTYAGVHRTTVNDREMLCAVYVHDIGKNKDKKVGALNYGFSMVEAFDYVLGVDGDTVAEPDAVELLLKEIDSDPEIGGVSAIFTIDDSKIHGPIASWLVAGQRAQFAAFNLKAMQQRRNIPVLGGQFSIFSVRALQDVMRTEGQATPWIRQSEVEDSLLSLQIKSAGYATKISSKARAFVGGMTTLRALDGQQVKWNAGAVQLMRSYPGHPSLRQRWSEHLAMLFNGYNRFAFVFLLISSLWIHAFVFFPIWIIPTLIAILLNLKVALKMRDTNIKDVLFAALFVPAELYLWIRVGHFLRAWWQSFFSGSKDNWAAQARAEHGQGFSYLTAPIICVAIVIVAIVIQLRLSLPLQSAILYWGWLSLALLTVIQTIIMIWMIIRPSRGMLV